MTQALYAHMNNKTIIKNIVKSKKKKKNRHEDQWNRIEDLDE
jgi:hypothetical protein